MSRIKADNDKEQTYFNFLERLRRSGVTNMWGASPYLRKAFGIRQKTADAVLVKWIKLHDAKRILKKAG